MSKIKGKPVLRKKSSMVGSTILRPHLYPVQEYSSLKVFENVYSFVSFVFIYLMELTTLIVKRYTDTHDAH